MSSIFGSTSGSSLFGQNNQQQQTNNPFGSTTNDQSKPSLFGSLNTTTSQSQTGGGLFGSTTQPQQTGGGLFGSQQQQPQQSGGSIFGNLGTSTNQQTSQTGGGLFGSTAQPQQAGGGLFGGQQQNTQQGTGLFGNLGSTTSQPLQQQTQQPIQQQQGGGLFGSLGQSAQQPQQGPQQGSVLGQTSRVFQPSETYSSRKSITDQIELSFNKWNPEHPGSPFSTYLYNNVPVDQAPFYGPSAQDDETRYEEALRKKPRPGAIPILVKGFLQVGRRMMMQIQALKTLQGRLHEINNGLNDLLQRHDLQISIRAAECRRKHLRISQQCLSLAAKTQILRNRGYAMDSTEEELRKKLMVLERSVFDPALNGRGEEIWARMVSVRERGRQLEREFEKAGRSAAQGKEQVIDEEVMRRVKKILEDYSSQLAQLTKELAQIQRDYAEWEQSKPLNGR
ncbi:nuclear pore complex protein Nup54, partial [Lecanoromycetidae sp. Uapishka_2]